MQFFLDDDTVVPIRLYSSSNAPKRQAGPGETAPLARQHVMPRRAERSVPGYPFIRFVDDDDYDGSFSFDALHALRSAYTTSPLIDIQQQMRTIQQQRAQAQLQRTLLAEQLRDYQRREQKLDELQRYLERQRQVHARQAAHRARATYLARLAEEERTKQIDQYRMAQERAAEDAKGATKDQSVEDDVVFYPPFHFFNHILSNQLNSQDEIASKQAQKNALGELLDAYFGNDAGNGAKNGAAPTAAPQLPAATKNGPAVTRPVDSEESKQKTVPEQPLSSSWAPPALQGPTVVDQNTVDNVLRVVRNRLDEIGAEEDEESLARRRSSAPKQLKQVSVPKEAKDERRSSDAGNNVHVDVVEEFPAQPTSPFQPHGAEDRKPEDAAVQVEEPTDYRKAAQSLRNRIEGLNDDNMFLSLSPLLGSRDDDDDEDLWGSSSGDRADGNAAHRETPVAAADTSRTAMDVDNGDSHEQQHEHSDSEFSNLLNTCKCQLKDMQAATAGAAEPSETTRRSRKHRRGRRHKSVVTQQEEAVAGKGRRRHHLDTDHQQEARKTRESAAINEASKPEAEDEERVNRITKSLGKLHEIGKELDAVREDYNQRLRDTQLSFVADKNGHLKLAYNRSNSTFHEYQESLQRLLLRLDEIMSYGDLAIRDKRKAIVKKIQNTLDTLDQFAADQESELSESSPYDMSSWADESSNAE